MAGREPRLDAHLVQQGGEAQTQSLNAHEIELGAEQPARVIFAKAGRLHQRQAFVFERVGRQDGNGLGKHGSLAEKAALGRRERRQGGKGQAR